MSAAALTPLALPLDANWPSRANCTGLGDAMYPDLGDQTGEQMAKRVCRHCPVKPDCLNAALELRDYWGVQGGLAGRERRRLVEGDKGQPCADCGVAFTPRVSHQKRCTDCVKANTGHHYGVERATCTACGASAYVEESSGQLGRHKVPGKGHARAFCRGGVTQTEQREDYLHQINRCEHRPEWRQPGGLCGGCGKDDFAEMGEAA